MKRKRKASFRSQMKLVIGVTAACLVAAAIAIAGFVLTRDDEALGEIEPPECQTGPVVNGIDVSYYQETIDWKRVRWAGVHFAFIRISDGLTVPDTMFAANWAGAKSNGVLRGAYQYFRPGQSAIAQADLVIAALKADAGEIAVAIDVETSDGLPPEKVAAGVRRWIDRVRSKLHVEPIVYTGPDFWKYGVGGADVPQPLWIAHYTGRCPTVPEPWKRWTFWQHTDAGKIRGIYGKVDLDVFAGTLDELRATTLSTAR